MTQTEMNISYGIEVIEYEVIDIEVTAGIEVITYG